MFFNSSDESLFLFLWIVNYNPLFYFCYNYLSIVKVFAEATYIYLYFYLPPHDIQIRDIT